LRRFIIERGQMQPPITINRNKTKQKATQKVLYLSTTINQTYPNALNKNKNKMLMQILNQHINILKTSSGILNNHKQKIAGGATDTT
jgi:hypothetical protein